MPAGRKFPLDMLPALEEAAAATSTGRFAEAEEILEAIIDVHPTLVPARAGLALTLLNQRRYAEALDAADTGLTLLAKTSPADDITSREHDKRTLETCRGSALTHLGSHREGIAILRRLRDELPDPGITIELGRSLQLSGDLEGAERLYLDAVMRTDDPLQKATFYNNTAILHAERGNWADSLTFFKWAAEAAPEDSDVHLEYAIALGDRGRFPEALSEIRRACALNPRNARASKIQRSIRAAEKKDRQTARRRAELEAACSGPDAAAKDLIALAGLYNESGRAVDSVTVLQRAVEKDPADFDAVLLLLNAYAQMELLNRAESVTTNALKHHPHDPALLTLQGSVAQALGRSERAYSLWSEATHSLLAAGAEGPARNAQAATQLAESWAAQDEWSQALSCYVLAASLRRKRAGLTETTPLDDEGFLEGARDAAAAYESDPDDEESSSELSEALMVISLAGSNSAEGDFFESPLNAAMRLRIGDTGLDPNDLFGALLGGAPEDEEGGHTGTFTRDSPKVGRNEPCPCGSGKKYKRCCG